MSLRIPPLTNFDAFRDAISTYRLPRILFTALDLDLFTAMGTRAWTISALAKKLHVSERGSISSAAIWLVRESWSSNGRRIETAMWPRRP